MRYLFRLLLAGLLFPALPATAAVWAVPDSVSTIAGAVALAARGDTVLIACGVYSEHDITLTDAVVIQSESGDPDCVVIDAGSAGRVFMSDDPAGEARIEGITITGGSAPGLTALTGWGGGLLFIGAPPTLVRCRITGNSASVGGGLALGGHGVPTLTECEITGNSAVYGGGLLGQVVTATLTGCTFSANDADSSGGGIYASLSDLTLDGCTFHGNAAALDGGALYGDLETVITLANTILSFGPAAEAVWCDETSFATATCCDVFGNVGGDWVGALAGQDGANGNFSADPGFCDAAAGDLGLRADSPCLDGRHPVGDPCGRIGAWDEACGATAVDGGRPVRPGPFLRAWPNPFRGSVRLTYELPAPGAPRIEIFDVTGRRVRSFAPAGISGELTWDGRDDSGRAVAAGIYHIRLQSAAPTAIQRVLFLR